MAQSTPGLSRLGQAAQAYAKKGWYVFPCKKDAKEPATRSGLHAATIDEMQIRRWWMQDDYNIGVVAGPSGLVVVDLDLPSVILDRARDYRVPEEVPGVAAWNALLELNDLTWEDTTTVATPRGGLHLYYRAPADVEIRPSAGTLATNVDVRAAESYVLAPPSRVHGRPYTVAVKAALLELPQALVELFRKPERSTVDDALGRLMMATRTFSMDGEAFTRFIQASCERLRNTAITGSRNQTFNAIAYHVFNITSGMPGPRAEAEFELRLAALSIGLTEKEIDKTLRSALRAVPF